MPNPKQSGWQAKVAQKLESKTIQNFVIGVIIFNAIIMGLETSPDLMASWGGTLIFLDHICLAIFVLELVLKMAVYRLPFFKDGWNIFDTLVVAIAFLPGAGPWSVLRSLRVLRVLRLLTAAPSLKRVVAALFHAIPGLSGVIIILGIFFYSSAILATGLFGEAHPEWFGSLGRSFYTLFQIMTLESWSMGIVRPVMETHPWAWAFFIPFIVIATFTILNLFLGIIVNTMQELEQLQDPTPDNSELVELMERMEKDLSSLKTLLERQEKRKGE